MKKTFIIFGLAAIASIAFSCTREDGPIEKETIPSEEQTTPGEEQETSVDLSQYDPSKYLVSFGASTEDVTKAEIDLNTGAENFGAVRFQNDDKVLVVSGNSSAEYTYNGTEFEAVSTPVEKSGEIKAYYPKDKYTYDAGTGTVTFTMPEATTANPGALAPMCGVITENTASFKNLGAILALKLTGAEPITAIELITDKAITGSSALSWNEGIPAIGTLDGATSVKYEYTSAIAAETATSLYFFLPAGVEFGSLEIHAIYGKTVGEVTYEPFRKISRNSSMTPARNEIVSITKTLSGFFSGGDGLSEATAYEIANANDFKKISTLANATEVVGGNGYNATAGRTFFGSEGVYYKQTEAVDFGDGDITANMIGSATTPFTGTYDGQSYNLTKFSISGTEECTGLWRVTSGATLKNVKVTSSTVTSTAGIVGSLVGRADNGLTLDSCISTATVTANEQTQVGGLVGLSTGGMTIKGCVNQGDVTGANYTGGLVGYINTGASSTIGKNSSDMPTYNRGTVSGNSAVGGIVGETTGNTTITDGTYNAGNITGSGQNVGGLVGRQNKDGYVLTINGASSNGIPAIENPSSQIIIKSTRADADSNQSNVGGLVGNVEKGTIAISGNCFNRGDVTGSAMSAGGIVGRIATADCVISECINYGNISTTGTKNSNNYTGGILGCSTNGKDATIISCTNNGYVTSTKTFVGGIAGRFYNGTIDLCVNAGNVNATAANANNVGGITGGIYTATVKRCYSAKGITIEGGTRVGGIVGIVEQGGKVISCASYSFIKGKYTSTDKDHVLGVGCVVGVESNADALIANCVALYDDANTENHYSLSSGKSTAKKYTGGLVGAKVAGTLQNCYCKVPARWIGFVYNTSGSIVAGTTTNTANTPYMGQIAGRNTAGDVKDCYYGGFNNGRGAIDFGTHVDGTSTNVTLISADAKTQYMHNTTVPVDITTSTGKNFAAGTKYLKDILDGGLTGGTIPGYTPASGEVLTWSNLSASDFTPIPTAILDLYNATEN